MKCKIHCASYGCREHSPADMLSAKEFKVYKPGWTQLHSKHFCPLHSPSTKRATVVVPPPVPSDV